MVMLAAYVVREARAERLTVAQDRRRDRRRLTECEAFLLRLARKPQGFEAFRWLTPFGSATTKPFWILKGIFA